MSTFTPTGFNTEKQNLESSTIYEIYDKWKKSGCVGFPVVDGIAFGRIGPVTFVHNDQIYFRVKDLRGLYYIVYIGEDAYSKGNALAGVKQHYLSLLGTIEEEYNGNLCVVASELNLVD